VAVEIGVGVVVTGKGDALGLLTELVGGGGGVVVLLVDEAT